MPNSDSFIPEDLFVGEPAIEVRWRLQNGALPLKNRHLRAFRAHGVSNGLDSWARQHIEWTLGEGAVEEPDGVLVIDVDAGGRAVMSIAQFEALPALSAELLLDRVSDMAAESVEPEVLWLVHEGSLIALTDEKKQLSGVNSLVYDLAETLHTSVVFAGHDQAARDVAQLASGDECFLASDEHGVVASSDFAGNTCEQYAAYYRKLISLAKPDRRDR
jgi:hypothetical protein